MKEIKPIWNALAILLIAALLSTAFFPLGALGKNQVLGQVASAQEESAGVSYIIVHALNPEGVEIASIEGMDSYCVEIYDGDTLIGYGAYNEETYNKPIEISPGEHIIRVKFNEIELSQTVNLNEGETKILTFVFERTEFDLWDKIPQSYETSVSISGSWTGITPRIKDETLDNLGWRLNVHFEEPYDGGYDEEGNYIRSSGSYSGIAKAKWIKQANQLNYELHTDYNININPVPGRPYLTTPYWASSVDGSTSDEIPLELDNPLFEEWFIQYFNHCTDLSLQIADIELLDHQSNYIIKSVPTTDTSMQIKSAEIATWGGNWHPINKTGGGELNIKMSSVPYDLTGTGIGGENQPPVASFTYSKQKMADTYGTTMVSFDASSSYDPDGTIVEYHWDYGDGESGQGKDQFHAYHKSGEYPVTLTVKDDEELKASTSQTIEVIQRELDEETTYQMSSTAPDYDPASVSSPYYEYIGRTHSDPGAPPTGATGCGIEYGIDKNNRLFLSVDVQVTTGEPEHYGQGEYLQVWVDWDGDKVFEAGELVMAESKLAEKAYPTPYNGTLHYAKSDIDIPYSTARNTWMRAALSYGYPASAAGSWTWGDIEDYEIEIPFIVTKEGQKEHAKNARNEMLKFSNGVECFSFGTTIISPIEIISSVAAAIITGGSLTPVFILSVGALISSATLTGLERINEKGIEALDKIIDDPPDTNYTEVVELEPFETYLPIGDSTFDIALANTFDNLSEQQAILKALVTSLERYDGALQAHEGQYMLLQAKAVYNFSDMLVSNLEKLTLSLHLLSSEARAIESDADISAGLAAMQQRLATQGFTEDELQYFRDAGASDAQIETLKQMLLDINIGTFASTVEGLRNVMNDGIPIYIDLSAQALSIAEALASGLPQYVYFQSGSDMVVVDYAKAVNDAMNDDNTLYNAVKEHVGKAELTGAPVIVETDTQAVLNYQKALSDGKRLADIVNDPAYEAAKPEANKELRVEGGQAVIGDVQPAEKNLDVPYLRQCGDTADDFDGRWACGATSAVMITAFYGRLPKDPIQCTVCKPDHWSDYGKYVSEAYSLYGYTFDKSHPTQTGSGCGAYGHIHDYMILVQKPQNN